MSFLPCNVGLSLDRVAARVAYLPGAIHIASELRRKRCAYLTRRSIPLGSPNSPTSAIGRRQPATTLSSEWRTTDPTSWRSSMVACGSATVNISSAPSGSSRRTGAWARRHRRYPIAELERIPGRDQRGDVGRHSFLPVPRRFPGSRGRVHPTLHGGLGPDPSTAVPSLRLPGYAGEVAAEPAAFALCAGCRRRPDGGIFRFTPVSRRTRRPAARTGIAPPASAEGPRPGPGCLHVGYHRRSKGGIAPAQYDQLRRPLRQRRTPHRPGERIA